MSDFILTQPPRQPRIKSKKDRGAKGAREAIHSSESEDYYTPAPYVEAARLVMGGIDLDPASCEEANLVVRATSIFTVANDGLSLDWFGRVWLNPPYGDHPVSNKSNQAVWSERLLLAYRHGRVEAAVMLVNAVTDRKWFQPLWGYSICFTDHRIKFLTPADIEDKHQPTHGNALVYLGTDHARFSSVFKRFGPVVGAGSVILPGP